MCRLCIFALTLDNLDFSCRYLSGMGTEIEGKVYIPGYFDMAGSSVNSNGNVLLYYEEGKSSLHLIDKFTIVSATGSVHYDREMLKRTMLVHEATFQKQVYFMTSRFLVIDI
jgi:general stress protein 26